MSIYPWSQPPSRKQQTILNRLRIGHTRLAHGHTLMAREEQPIRSACGTPVTVQLVISDCRSFEDAKIANNISVSLAEALSPDPVSTANLFNFLKNCELYDKIENRLYHNNSFIHCKY